MSFTLDKFIEQNRQEDKEFDEAMARQEVAQPIAIEIIRLRDAAGLTQGQLAELIGTKQPAIARLESGESVPSVQTLYKIASVLGQTLTVQFSPMLK